MKFKLGFLKDRRLRLVRPVVVTGRWIGDKLYLQAWGLECYGWGKNKSAAVSDLQDYLSQWYWQGKEHRRNLGEHLLRLHDRLARKIKEERQS